VVMRMILADSSWRKKRGEGRPPHEQELQSVVFGF